MPTLIGSPPPVDPAPLAASAVLPRPRSSFIGRAREVSAVRALLGRREVRLLTLTGPGGVGKTRLAIEAVSGGDGPADHVWFAPLATVRDPALALPTITTAPEPWQAAGEPFGTLAPLRAAVLARGAASFPAIPDRALAEAEWAAGRGLPVDEAVDLALDVASRTAAVVLALRHGFG